MGMWTKQWTPVCFMQALPATPGSGPVAEAGRLRRSASAGRVRRTREAVIRRLDPEVHRFGSLYVIARSARRKAAERSEFEPHLLVTLGSCCSALSGTCFSLIRSLD